VPATESPAPRPRPATRRTGLALAGLAAAACAPGGSGAAPVGSPAAGGGGAPDDLPPVFDRSAPVTVQRGGPHTVYHSAAPLPTAGAPRPDGRATLVWFSQPG